MVSVVIPLFNEEESITLLIKRLKAVLPSLDKRYEIIFIDDGSTDGSLSVLKKIAREDKTLRIFSFRRNRGKAEALTLGFQVAKGDYIATLDADLQDRPEELEKLYKKIQEGYDVVSGWKKQRHDPFYKVIASRLFNTIVGFLFRLHLHDYNCGLKIYTREAAEMLHLYGGMHRFIPLLSYEQGFKITEVPVEHDSRKFGRSKYGISKMWKDLPDLFTMLFLTRFGKRPLHFFGWFGTIVFLIGAVVVIYFWVLHTFYKLQVGDRPLLFIGIVCILAGLQVAFTGFLADLIINVFHSPQLERDSMHYFIKYTTDKAKETEIEIE